MTEERKLLRECVEGLEAEVDAGWSPDAKSHLRKLRVALNLLATEPEPVEGLKRQLAEAHERIKYYESITTGSEHKAIDRVIQEQKK